MLEPKEMVKNKITAEIENLETKLKEVQQAIEKGETPFWILFMFKSKIQSYLNDYRSMQFCPTCGQKVI